MFSGWAHSMADLTAMMRKVTASPTIKPTPMIRTVCHLTLYSQCMKIKQGAFWIGLFGGGLAKFDRENEHFTHYQTDAQNENSLSNNLVTSFFEDEAGTLWIGTVGGLNKLDQQREHFTHFREKDGLPNDTVLGILEDEQGNLWLSTNNGLSKFDPQTETFVNYDESDGCKARSLVAGRIIRIAVA